MHGLQTKSANNTKFIIGLLSQINKLADEQLYMCNMLIHTFVPLANFIKTAVPLSCYLGSTAPKCPSIMMVTKY